MRIRSQAHRRPLATIFIMKFDNLTSFIMDLKKPLQDLKEDIREVLREGEAEIQRDSQSMIPYDTGEAHDSYFHRIEEEPHAITLIVWYDEDGALEHLPLIHEIGPIEGGYGWKAKEPEVQYTEEGFIISGADGLPQTQFLLKAMQKHWPDIQTKLRKVVK